MVYSHRKTYKGGKYKEKSVWRLELWRSLLKMACSTGGARVSLRPESDPWSRRDLSTYSSYIWLWV